MTRLHVTSHAFMRYHEFYPGEGYPALIEAAKTGEDVPPGVAAPLLGRPLSRCVGTAYRLHPERSGMFALVGVDVVTFLRFELSQHRAAVEMYGPGYPLGAFVPWREYVP